MIEKFELNDEVIGVTITETIGYLNANAGKWIQSPHEIVLYTRSGLDDEVSSVEVWLSVGFLLYSPGVNEIAAYLNRVVEEKLKRAGGAICSI